MADDRREKLIARFGGVEDGHDIGAVILGEGPGGGFYSLPWALDHYERALDLSPAEAWLLKRIVKHSWQKGTLAFISLRKVERQAKIGHRTLLRLAQSLRSKGLIREVARGERLDRRVRYDTSNVWRALWACIQCDPLSKLRNDGIGWGVEDAREYARRHGFKLNWHAVGARDDAEHQRRVTRKRISAKRKRRIEELKQAIEGEFLIFPRWYESDVYADVLRLVAADVTAEDIAELAASDGWQGSTPGRLREVVDALLV